LGVLVMKRIVPLGLLGHAWLVTGLALTLNELRTLVAHAYRNTGDPLPFERQVADTLTLGGGWLAEMMAPLGDRFHAAHHRFPQMPYHNLGRAHQLLLRDPELGPSYRTTRRKGVAGALLLLFRVIPPRDV